MSGVILELSIFSELSHNFHSVDAETSFLSTHYFTRFVNPLSQLAYRLTLHDSSTPTSTMSNSSTWRDRYWSDISGQLLRLNTIDKTHFDGSLLKKDTANGAWLWSWLVPHTFPPTTSHPVPTLFTFPGARIRPT